MQDSSGCLLCLALIDDVTVRQSESNHKSLVAHASNFLIHGNLTQPQPTSGHSDEHATWFRKVASSCVFKSFINPQSKLYKPEVAKLLVSEDGDGGCEEEDRPSNEDGGKGRGAGGRGRGRGDPAPGGQAERHERVVRSC